MSDITPELVEASKARDSRMALIGEHFAVEAELRDSATIRHLLRQVTTDADNAMEELADVSPLDHEAVARLLVKIQSYVYIRRSLVTLKARAGAAMQEIRLEDAAAADE